MLNQKIIEMKHDQKEIQEVTSKKGQTERKAPQKGTQKCIRIDEKKLKTEKKKCSETATVLIEILCQIEEINSTSIEGKLKPIQSTQSRNQLE